MGKWPDFRFMDHASCQLLTKKKKRKKGHIAKQLSHPHPQMQLMHQSSVIITELTWTIQIFVQSLLKKRSFRVGFRKGKHLIRFVWFLSNLTFSESIYFSFRCLKVCENIVFCCLVLSTWYDWTRSHSRWSQHIQLPNINRPTGSFLLLSCFEHLFLHKTISFCSRPPVWSIYTNSRNVTRPSSDNRLKSLNSLYNLHRWPLPPPPTLEPTHQLRAQWRIVSELKSISYRTVIM